MIQLHVERHPENHTRLAKYIIKRTHYYHHAFGLDDYEVWVIFNHVEEKMGAETEAKPQYLRAEYKYDLDELCDKHFDEVDTYVRHEVFHTWQGLYRSLCLFQAFNYLGGQPLHQLPVSYAHGLGGGKDNPGNLSAVQGI